MARVALKACLMTALVLMSASAGVAANTTAPKCTKTYKVAINVKQGKAVIDPAKNAVVLRTGECVRWYVASPAGKYRVARVRVLRKGRQQRAAGAVSQTGIERVRFLPQTHVQTPVPSSVPGNSCCDLCTCTLLACDRLTASCPGAIEAEVQVIDPATNKTMLIDEPTIVVNCTQPCRPKIRELIDRYGHDAKACDPAKGCNPGSLHDHFWDALMTEIEHP